MDWDVPPIVILPNALFHDLHSQAVKRVRLLGDGSRVQRCLFTYSALTSLWSQSRGFSVALK